MYTKFTRHLFLFLSVIVINASALAASQKQIETIKEVATEHVKTLVSPPKNGELKISAGYVDTRLKLTDCPSPLIASIPARQQLQRSVTVLVECETTWQVYLPVNIRLHTLVVIAKRPLDRGLTLTDDDLSLHLLDTRFQRGHTFTNVSQLIGARVKRNIGLNEALQGNDICIVCRNDVVILNANQENLNIVAKGTALGDGSLGEQIKVRNNKSNRIVDATITGVGQVAINF